MSPVLHRPHLGVHSLDSFVLSVPDLAEAERFYSAFGLRTVRHGDSLDLYTYGHGHRWARIHRGGARKRLQYISFACFADDLDFLQGRLNEAKIETTSAPALADDSSGLWVRHPDGFPVRIVVGDKVTPDAPSEAYAVPTRTVGTRGAPGRSAVQQVRPRRLSHVLFFTPDVNRAIGFYELLGIRVSDRSGGVIAFMHGPHGSDHHLIALAKSDGPGLHHSSWDVGSIDDVGSGMEQMTRAGYSRGWGVGRHVLGSNYFYYVRDPWGSYSEYSFDIDYVPAGTTWPTGDHPAEDSIYMWGPQPPADFITNFETDAASS